MSLCLCGCGKETFVPPYNCRTHGWVKGEPRPYVRGHSTRLGPRWEIDEATGCWNWTGSFKNDYGSFWLDNKQYAAHRWSYETHVGPIPEGLQIDHLCCNKACVNPEHLEAVTPAENTRRGRAAKLNLTAAREIRESDEDARVLAARFGVTRGNVYAVRNGLLWRESA